MASAGEVWSPTCVAVGLLSMLRGCVQTVLQLEMEFNKDILWPLSIKICTSVLWLITGNVSALRLE